MMKLTSMNSCKAQAHNPLKAIIELIPYTESVLDVLLLDSIRMELYKVLKTPLIHNSYISDSYILFLLAYLSDEGILELTKINPVSSLGTIHFIKRL